MSKREPREVDEIRHKHDVLRAGLELEELIDAVCKKYKLTRWDVVWLLRKEFGTYLEAIQHEHGKMQGRMKDG